jgi:phosphatidylglycerophosphate synthase
VVARAPRSPDRDDVPDRATYLRRWAALHGGYDPRRSRAVTGWLGVTYAVARPLAARRVPPDALTGAGAVASAGVAALAAAGGRWSLAAVAVVVASGLLDGLDGAVALLTDRATRFGSVLDSVADRVSDGLYLVALWLLGAPGGLVVAGGAVTGLHEYTRARAGAVGMSEIGVVSVAERPTRVLVAAFTLAAAGALPGRADDAALVGAGVWGVLGVVGLVQVLAAVRRRLR